ncbi:MAG: response regulator transcription factor [Ignavibacteriaceae bacterium]
MKLIHLHIFSMVPLTIEGIKSVVKSGKISVSSESKNIRKVLKLARGNFPGILLIDDSYLDKKEAAFFLNNLLKTPCGTRTIIFTRSNDNEYLNNLAASGIRGILHEKATKEKTLEAIELLSTGGVYFDNYVNSIIIESVLVKEVQKDGYLKHLSKRETEILKLISHGLKNKEIAEILFISQGTVESHKTNLLKKLKLKSSSELTMFAITNKSQIIS